MKWFSVTTDMKGPGEMNVLFICSRLLSITKEPEMVYVKDVGQVIAENMKKGTMSF